MKTFTLSAFFIWFSLATSLAQNNYFQQTDLFTPCPLYGFETNLIEGLLLPGGDIKPIPVSTNDCIPSVKYHAYKEHFISLLDSGKHTFILSGDFYNCQVYHDYYFPGEPCYNLIFSGSSGDTFSIQNGVKPNLYIMVVTSEASAMDSVYFSISTSQNIGKYNEECIFMCKEFNDVFNQKIAGPPITISPNTNHMYKENITNIESFCKKRILKEHLVTIQNQTFKITSDYIFRYQNFETNFHFDTFNIRCNVDPFSLDEIKNYLMQTYNDSLSREFIKLSSNIGDNNCYEIGFSVSKDNTGTDIDGNQIVKYNFTMLNWCSSKIFQNDVHFRVLPFNDIDTFILKDTSIVIGFLDFCSKKFIIPHPDIVLGCQSNPLPYAVIIEPFVPVSIENNRYTVNLSEGIYSIKYTLEDCCHTIPITGEFTVNVTVWNQFQVTNYGPFSLNIKTTAKIPIDNAIISHCLNTKNELIFSSSICDTLNPDYITFCCDDMTMTHDNFVNTGEIEYGIKTWIDKNNDGIFTGPKDTFFIFSSVLFINDKMTDIICPPDVKLSCHDTLTDPSILGYAQVSGVCFDYTSKTFTDKYFDFGSDSMVIKRTFSFAGYNAGKSCEQRILFDCTVSAFTPVISENLNVITVKPNPFSNATVVTFENPQDQFVKIKLNTVSGITVWEDYIFVKEGENSYTITSTNLPVAGLYILQLKFETHEAFTRILFTP